MSTVVTQPVTSRSSLNSRHHTLTLETSPEQVQTLRLTDEAITVTFTGRSAVIRGYSIEARFVEHPEDLDRPLELTFRPADAIEKLRTTFTKAASPQEFDTLISRLKICELYTHESGTLVKNEKTNDGKEADLGVVAAVQFRQLFKEAALTTDLAALLRTSTIGMFKEFK